MPSDGLFFSGRACLAASCGFFFARPERGNRPVAIVERVFFFPSRRTRESSADAAANAKMTTGAATKKDRRARRAPILGKNKTEGSPLPLPPLTAPKRKKRRREEERSDEQTPESAPRTGRRAS